MLVAGHETTASAMTWTLYLMVQNPHTMQKAKEEVDRVLGEDKRAPDLAGYKGLQYLTRCVNESMRLYPHPPVLLRRALVEDVLPYKNGAYKVRRGQDVMLSIYNIHRSPDVWEQPNDFVPERFSLEDPVPNEQTTDYKYIPFSGGPRKCIGEQFALMEAVVGLAVIIKSFDFELVPGFEPGLTTGATIHTANGLFLYVKKRGATRGVKNEEAVTV